MQFLFRITRNNVDTLLRGVHFETDGKEIIFLDDNTKISIEDLYQLIFDSKHGLVIFSLTQDIVYELQREILDMEVRYEQ